MGGFGSGKRGGKACTDDVRRLDIRVLEREGYLRPGSPHTSRWSQGGELVATAEVTDQVGRVWIEYRQRDDDGRWLAIGCPVQLDRTPCHLGGSRVWWRCPAQGCGRRVAVLHFDEDVACRRCLDLAYRCQREVAYNRALRRADKLRQRMGWVPGIAHGAGLKPKGMHWRTFDRLRALHEAQVRAVRVAMTEHFKWGHLSRRGHA